MRKIWSPLSIALLTAPLLLVACSDEGSPVVPDEGGGTPDDPVSFAQEVQPIFDARCVECHGIADNGGLDLRGGQSYGDLVGVESPNYGAPRVEPGDPSGSVLYDKITGGGVYGDQMPLGRTPLSGAQIETIRTWIAQGALDN